MFLVTSKLSGRFFQICSPSYNILMNFIIILAEYQINQHIQRKLLYFVNRGGDTVPSRQKLGIILENKVFQKLKLYKNVNNEK